MSLKTVSAIGFCLFVLSLFTSSCVRQSGSDVSGAVRDSLALVARRVDSLAAQAPGLGEFMTAIQLHAAKTWFAGTAGNWALADYEMHELMEAVEGAEGIHAVRNGIEITAVLQGVADTVVAPLRAAITARATKNFRNAYHTLITRCNACHTATGFPFIVITLPTAPPVSNQAWRVGN